MIANILAPLDGSALAERARPFATSLARAADARLWLVQALPATAPLLGHAPGLDTAADIEGIAARLRERGLKATARTVHGDAANAILDAAVDMPADLIVMSTHGRGGLGRWLYGSAADQVLRRRPSRSCWSRPRAIIPGPPIGGSRCWSRWTARTCPKRRSVRPAC